MRGIHDATEDPDTGHTAVTRLLASNAGRIDGATNVKVRSYHLRTRRPKRSNHWRR